MVGPPLNTLKPNPPAAAAASAAAATTTIKFLYSYGGKIVPRYTDGKLRYHGGQTRVLAVDRSISFAELLVKLGELCGTSVSLRCQLPTEDLDALVSITSDDDLANLLEEYDRVASPPSAALKIRAFLSPPRSAKKISPPPSAAASAAVSTNLDAASAGSFYYVASSSRFPDRCIHPMRKPAAYPPRYEKSAAGKVPYRGTPSRGGRDLSISRWLQVDGSLGILGY